MFFLFRFRNKWASGKDSWKFYRLYDDGELDLNTVREDLLEDQDNRCVWSEHYRGTDVELVTDESTIRREEGRYIRSLQKTIEWHGRLIAGVEQGRIDRATEQEWVEGQLHG